jgi:pyruvate dehydrogenase E1 component alpha subunit/2-oxoisovalerate dehydrogenase E1 component alpha subunit
VQRLPLIVIAEYNHYAYSTPTNMQTAVRNLAEKAAAFGIPGYIVDGNDVIACYEVTRRAMEHARAGHGAVLIEAKTYRRKGHAEHDDQRYIPEGEIEWWEQHNDPVDRFEKFLMDQTIATKEKLDEITAGVMREIDEDCEWAESSPMPEPEGAVYGVFDNSIVSPAFRPKVLES